MARVNLEACDIIIDENYLADGYLDTAIDWIPGMKNIRLRDLPSFIRTTDPNEVMVHFCIEESKRARRASALIFNTFDVLEKEVLDQLALMFPRIYSIGPLHLLLNQVSDDNLKMVGSNLWKEDPGCLKWLDTKESNSVVYVNFGSITVMTPKQLTEFAWGLANSNQAFLWIIRPDLVTGDSAVLPNDFLFRIKDRGLLANWCHQEQVLSHPAIGGFLTHSGWNSTLESISNGIPIVCWPFFAEQPTNCRYSCTEWGIGMEIDSNVKRDVVENLVRELMDGEKGKEMKQQALKWKKKAEEAASASTGSSYLNFEEMVNEVLRKRVD